MDFPTLFTLGCTHVITLLKENEGAERYGNLTRESGMEWIWLPVPNGKYPDANVKHLLLEAMPKLSGLLDHGNSLLIHCSAGIHRTGMVAYGLLRWRGLDRSQAIKLIDSIRKETAVGMLEKRMRWGDEIARTADSQDYLWYSSARRFVNRFKMKIFRPR
ncbi:MAG TPA: tyrosine-protein phosphatase [Anaerolineales bacterium]|nr:tyrosine-protein phosphatase [Anaerolineales bacterium]